MKTCLYIALVAFLAVLTTTCKSHNQATEAVAQSQADSAMSHSVLTSLDCNKQAFGAILQQLNLKLNECDLSSVSQKILPADKALSAWIIPKIVNREEGDLDGYIVLAETETGKIVSRCAEPEQWFSADGSQFRFAAIDTLDFCLNDNRIMFGIRTEHCGSSIDHPFVDTELKLFVQQADKLLPVFAYDISSDREDENSDDSFVLCERKVVVTKQQSKGFYDFALITNMQRRKAGESEIDYSINDSINLYRYTGKEYEEVTKSHTAVVYLERMGESSNKDWFYYGKSMEQAYDIYLNCQEEKEEEKYLQSVLKAKMPKENLEYVVKDKPDGDPESDDNLEVTVTYTYDSENCLIIHMEHEYGSRRVVITEKKGYTQLIEVLTD